MKIEVRVASLIMVLVATGALRGAEAPPATTQSWDTPRFTVPYGRPTVESIQKTLARVRDRLERATGVAVVDRKTKEPVADLSWRVFLTNQKEDLKLASAEPGPWFVS